MSELSVAWDGQHVIVEAGGAGAGPAVDAGRMRVAMSVPATHAFVTRGRRRSVAAGRPPCVLCGMPADGRPHLPAV